MKNITLITTLVLLASCTKEWRCEHHVTEPGNEYYQTTHFTGTTKEKKAHEQECSKDDISQYMTQSMSCYPCE